MKDATGTYNGGWGFCPARTSAYEMFADGDTRRDASVIDYRTVGAYGSRFQDTGYFFKKYTARSGYRKSSGDLDLNYCNNSRMSITMSSLVRAIVTMTSYAGVMRLQC